jgi:hypothetical protein
MSQKTDKVFVRYTLFGNWNDLEIAEERRFRNELLGSNHWSVQSTAAIKREYTIFVIPEIAMLFLIKFKGATIDKGMIVD